jgi:uncharacterized protein
MSTFEQGEAAYEVRDYDTALNIFMPLAESGDIKAQMSVAGMYSTGCGVRQNFTEAAKWYRIAAEQGDSVAQNNLAVMLFYDDPEEAIKWLFVTAEKGVSMAQSMLGDVYSGTYNIPSAIQEKFRDDLEAIKWYQKAGRGFSYAYHRLGEMFANGQGVGKNKEQALQYYRNAAEEGYKPSQEVLGKAYSEGLLGLPRDTAQSQFWYKQANESNGYPLN